MKQMDFECFFCGEWHLQLVTRLFGGEEIVHGDKDLPVGTVYLLNTDYIYLGRRNVF